MVISTGLKILYSFLYRKYINLNFLLWPPLPLVSSPYRDLVFILVLRGSGVSLLFSGLLATKSFWRNSVNLCLSWCHGPIALGPGSPVFEMACAHHFSWGSCPFKSQKDPLECWSVGHIVGDTRGHHPLCKYARDEFVTLPPSPKPGSSSSGCTWKDMGSEQWDKTRVQSVSHPDRLKAPESGACVDTGDWKSPVTSRLPDKWGYLPAHKKTLHSERNIYQSEGTDSRIAENPCQILIWHRIHTQNI
jgi:hypothetical protein